MSTDINISVFTGVMGGSIVIQDFLTISKVSWVSWVSWISRFMGKAGTTLIIGITDTKDTVLVFTRL